MNTNTENTDNAATTDNEHSEQQQPQQQPRKYPVFVTMGYERDMMNPPADAHW